jgi:soluble lytic murein transglycosylase
MFVTYPTAYTKYILHTSMIFHHQFAAKLTIALVLCCCIVSPIQAAVDKYAEQRKQYKAAKKSLRAGQIKSFKNKAEALRDYPLYPYLRYDYLSRRLWKIKNAEIVDFLAEFDDVPVANDLRVAWLKLLVKRGHWLSYIENYTPQADKTLQCHQLQARIKTKKTDYLLEDIRSVWLAGKSLPPQCDPAFALLYKSDLMTDELIWQRIRLSMENKQIGLATYLGKKLGVEKRKWLTRWIAIHHNPSTATRNPKYKDSPEAREILLHGMRRLIRQNIGRALSRWDKLKNNYGFSESEIAELERSMAIRAARKKHKQAKQLLDNIADTEINEEILHLRLRVVLNNKDWTTLIKWTQSEPVDDGIRLRWYYWRARALAETGNMAAANEIYTWLAKERDYYGFLAADKIRAPYQFNNRPINVHVKEKEKFVELPAIARAREFYLLGSYYSARREWHRSLPKLSSQEIQLAASIAADWGWHDRAIITLAEAQLYDDLVTRFPMPFNKTMKQFSKMRNLDPAWIYALTRAESAFIEDVRSPTGALGLMQVMPTTGRLTAKRIGLRNYNTKKLQESHTNVRIGSAYLKQMYKSFNNNSVLATAAYNAGPTNVKRWLPKTHCEEPDVWIEKIPFTETRKYVRRIFFFASVYEWRMERDITTIQKRMSMIQPKKQIQASKSCPVISG